MFTPLVEGFDPALAQPVQFNYLEPVYDTLLRQGPGGVISPDLATKWSFGGPGGLTFTLDLRKGVRFSNGQPFAAAAVVANLERDRQLGGPEAAYLKPIQSVSAPGAYTLEVHLLQPDAALPSVLSGVVGMMAAPSAFGHLKTDPVGTGGWVYSPSRSVPGAHYVYLANPHYWDPALQRAREIRIDVIPNETTILNALRAGQIDMAAINQSDAAAAVSSGLKVERIRAGIANVGILDLGGKLVPALSHVRVRQAMNYAVDRKAIVSALMYGFGIPDSQFYPPGFWAYDPALANAYPYNPVKARALLAAAGYPHGFSADIVTLAPFSTYIQAVQAQLAKVGVDLHIVIAPPGQLLHYLQSGRYPLVSDWGSQNGANTDPALAIAKSFLPNSPVNPFHIDNPELVKLAAEGMAKTTAAARAPIYRQIDSILTTDAWNIDIAINEVPFAYNPSRISRPVVTANGVATIADFYGLQVSG